MQIRLSRHSRRRMQLYRIDEATVRGIVDGGPRELGKHAVTEKVAGQKYPVKVVYVVEEQEVVIVTAYPLKKGAE